MIARPTHGTPQTCLESALIFSAPEAQTRSIRTESDHFALEDEEALDCTGSQKNRWKKNDRKMAKETDRLLENDIDDGESAGMFARMKQHLSNSLRSTDTGVAYREIKDALVDHLEEANEGDDFFLTMTLTKNLSLLPSKPEVEQMVDEAKMIITSIRRNLSTRSVPVRPESPEEEDPERAPPLSAYLTLGSAVCALSSIGPFLAKQLDVDATMKVRTLLSRFS